MTIRDRPVIVSRLDVLMCGADLTVTQVVWKETTQLGCGEFTCGVSSLNNPFVPTD